jgi:transcriptional regulator with XRE-family HTH domain
MSSNRSGRKGQAPRARTDAVRVVRAAPSSKKGGQGGRPTVDGLGDDVGAAELARRVADSLRRLRKERDLSFDDLALASGVSRAALSQIETCRSNPSLAVLWKIAVGLKVPFQSLLGPGEQESARLLHSRDATPLRSVDGRVESRLLSPSGAVARLEVYELRFQSKGHLQSEPHGAGANETVIMLTGALRVTLRSQTYELVPGDVLYFEANVAHSYENRSSHESRCIDVIGYGSVQ